MTIKQVGIQTPLASENLEFGFGKKGSEPFSQLFILFLDQRPVLANYYFEQRCIQQTLYCILTLAQSSLTFQKSGNSVFALSFSAMLVALYCLFSKYFVCHHPKMSFLLRNLLLSLPIRQCSMRRGLFVTQHFFFGQ